MIVPLDMNTPSRPAVIKRLILSGPVDNKSVGVIIGKIFDANEAATAVDRIHLYLSTTGGSVRDGFALYDVIRQSKIPVDTIAAGQAMSMGASLLQAGVVRYALPLAVVMLHPMKSGAGMDRTGESIAAVKDSLRLEKQLYKLAAARIGMSYKEYLEFVGDRIYLTPKQALKHNVIDAILDTRFS